MNTQQYNYAGEDERNAASQIEELLPTLDQNEPKKRCGHNTYDHAVLMLQDLRAGKTLEEVMPSATVTVWIVPHRRW